MTANDPATASSSRAPAAREVLARYLDGVAAGDWDSLPDCYADNVVVRHPFATDHSAQIVGKEQLREHFAQLGRLHLQMTAHDLRIHETADPEIIVAEFTYQGQQGRDGSAFEMPAVFVSTIRDGLIVESRDYLGPRRPHQGDQPNPERGV